MTTVGHFFTEVSKHASDVFWKNMFIGIAGGSMPAYFSMKDGYFVYKYARTFEQVLIPSDPAQACEALTTFIRNRSGISSPTDSSAATQVPIKPLTWARVKANPQMLSSSIRRYSIEVCSQVGIPDSEVVYKLLMAGINGGFVTDVRVENGVVTHIGQLMFIAHQRRFCLTRLTTPVSRGSSSSSTSTPICNRRWQAAVDGMTRHYLSISKTLKDIT